MAQQPKFRPGDKVRIVNYGELMWIFKEEWESQQNLEPESMRVDRPPNLIEEKENLFICDTHPEKVGEIDTVKEVKETQGQIKYSLENSAWYNEDQLEKINNYD